MGSKQWIQNKERTSLLVSVPQHTRFNAIPSLTCLMLRSGKPEISRECTIGSLSLCVLCFTWHVSFLDLRTIKSVLEWICNDIIKQTICWYKMFVFVVFWKEGLQQIKLPKSSYNRLYNVIITSCKASRVNVMLSNKEWIFYVSYTDKL